MHWFYFHVELFGVEIPDDRGVQLPDLAAAHACALQIMRKTMAHDPDERNWRGSTVKIADEQRRTLLTVLYHHGRTTFGKRMPQRRDDSTRA